MGINAIFNFLDKLISKLPIQDRKERIKNRINDIDHQQKDLTSGEATPKKTALYVQS